MLSCKCYDVMFANWMHRDIKEIDAESLPEGAIACEGLDDSVWQLESDSGQTMADDASVYQSTEPADDYSVIALYMFARA